MQWGDFLLYGLISLAGLALFLTGLKGTQAVGNSEASILVDNDEIRHVSYHELQDGGVYSFSANGYYYVAEFADGEIRMKNATCPDQKCVGFGWLNPLNDIAVCMPGHVLIRYYADNAADPPVDAGAR